MFYYLDQSAESSDNSDSGADNGKQGILKILFAYLIIQNILIYIRNQYFLVIAAPENTSPSDQD